MSLNDIAKACSTSEPTIMRFLHKLGFDSYQVFRVRIAQDTSIHPGQAVYEEIQVDDSVEQIREKVILSTVNSIQDLNNLLGAELLSQAVALLLKSKKILFCGVGASGVVAADGFHKFLRLGFDAAVYHDTHFMNIACAHVDEQAVVFAVSHSGESRDILEAVKLAKERGANVIAMTSYSHSSVTKYADVVLLSSANETKYRSDAVVSRILQLVIIDILSVALVMEQGPTGIAQINISRLAVAAKKK